MSAGSSVPPVEPASGVPPQAGPADYARSCVEAFVDGLPAPPAPVDALYDEVAACFCSIKKHGELRGCIGTLTPASSCLADEIARNAHAAAFSDPRFPPIATSELAALSYSVDVLSACEPCDRDALDPRRYGVIVSAGGRRGVLLPDLAGVETVERQLAIALQKAGIAPGADYAIERFTVTRFGEGCDMACG